MTKEIDLNNDFGFTFETDIDTQGQDQTIEELKAKIVELGALNEEQKANNRAIIKKVTTLMLNLKKDPDKAIIKWPNRAESIDKFLKEINEIHIKKDDKKD